MKTVIPTHVAIIMDGNRRWARKHKFSVFRGHDAGTKSIESLIEYAADLGIKFLTFWAFSTENWKRSEREVGFLFSVFRKFLKSSVVPRMIARGVKIRIIGEFTTFPEDIVREIKKLIEQTKNNTRITATFALNYGGRQEILRAVNAILKENVARSPRTEIDAETFSSYLYTSDLPDPDFIIRTGGAQRSSGFLLWQSEYAEWYFASTLWPDFDEKELAKALEEYAERERRFGK